jgi:hypothetical protein
VKSSCQEETLSIYLQAGLRETNSVASDFKKVVAARKLWNFDKRACCTWQEAL